MTRNRLANVFAVIILANFHLSAMAASMVRHDLREVMTVDSEEMERRVSKEINSNQQDDEVFYTQAAQVLTQTILIHPRLTERQAGLSRLKSKMEQEEFYYVMTKGADMLIGQLKDSSLSAREQATNLVALVNLVIEARSVTSGEMKPTLEKIAKTELDISDEARTYARESVKHLPSPTEEARLALGAEGSKNL